MTIACAHQTHLRGGASDGTCQARRAFLLGTAATGAAALLPVAPALGEQKTLIDTHHHFYPPDYQKLWFDWEETRKLPHFPGQVAWSKAKAIEDMDKAGIQTGMLSLASTPGLWFGLDAEKAGADVEPPQPARHLLRGLGTIALLPLFGLAFWFAATVASSLPGLGVFGVNVHGLGLASYAGDSALRHAPLSLQLLLDAQADAGGREEPAPYPADRDRKTLRSREIAPSLDTRPRSGYALLLLAPSDTFSSRSTRRRLPHR